jgi:uncharacterized protein (DUF1501 family)
MKRRDFIQSTLFASAGTMLVPSFLKKYEFKSINQRASSQKILVVIQLSGGNDGLNTVIPYRNDVYYTSRPKLAIQAKEVFTLNDEMGLNPALTGLKSLFDESYVSILNNVGYPNPDRSHFRSMDIWQTASHSDQYLNTGWVGRYLDSQCLAHPTENNAHHAIEIDDVLSLSMKGASSNGLALTNPQKLYQATQDKQFKSLVQFESSSDTGSNINYLYKTLAETISSADYIHQKTMSSQNTATYPDTEFAKRLKTIASLIISGVDTQIYYISLSGFDTHVNQKPQQERLLKMYGDAVNIFVNDLKSNNRLDDVLLMTFSEFGRRVTQNASGGTDHGTANNVFLIGNQLKQKGILNETPDLKDLDDGDLKFTTDFRSIYATILDKHLGVSSKEILDNQFPILDFI